MGVGQGEWNVVVLGGLNTDHLVRGAQLPGPGMSLDGEVFLEAPGGKGANAAALAVALVLPTREGLETYLERIAHATPRKE